MKNQNLITVHDNRPKMVVAACSGVADCNAAAGSILEKYYNNDDTIMVMIDM